MGLGLFRVPSGFSCNTFHLICVKHSLTFAHFGGWLAASFNDALNVTARCSYELCCQSIFDSVAA